MIKEAYEAGVRAALVDAGLLKSAVAAAQPTVPSAPGKPASMPPQAATPAAAPASPEATALTKSLPGSANISLPDISSASSIRG